MSYTILEPANKRMKFRISDRPISRRTLRVRNNSNDHMYLFLFAKNADISYPISEQTIRIAPGGESSTEIRLKGADVAPIPGELAILRVSVGFMRENIDPKEYWKRNMPQIDGCFGDIEYFDVRLTMEVEAHVAPVPNQPQNIEPVVQSGWFSCSCVFFWIVMAAIIVVGIIFRADFEDLFRQIYHWILGSSGQ